MGTASKVKAVEKHYLYDFYATWCGPCRVMFKELNHQSVQDALDKYNVEFIKIDVDKNKELTRKFKISSMPTLILIKQVDKQVTEIKRMVGVRDKQHIIDLIKLAQ